MADPRDISRTDTATPVESPAVEETLPYSGPLDTSALTRGAGVGRYLILDRLGAGGMGVVYAAYDPELDRKVAIKVLRAGGAKSDAEQQRVRLLREAQAMARLSHPNVIAVYDVGTVGNQVFLATEFVDGVTLAAWRRERERPTDEVLGVYRQAGRGLQAAHEAGIVHRDFKPDNVLIGRDGRVRVLDFGLARPATDSADPSLPAELRSGPSRISGSLATPLTQADSLIGTPAYMAPEQWNRLPADARSDQFSFCVSLYHALYGVRPFGGESHEELRVEVTAARLREPPPSSPVPAWLWPVVRRGLSHKPDDRFPSMEALLQALDRDPRRPRRQLLLGVGVAAAAIVTVVGWRLERRAQDRVCRGAEAKLAGVWDDARKRAAHDAFARSGKAYAEDAFSGAAHALDAYAAAWVAMHTDACEATRVRGEQSAELLDLRMECLDERQKDLRALTDLFVDADARTVERAVSAAGSLPPLAECANSAALRAPVRPPGDPETRRRVDEVARRVAETHARVVAGKYADAIAIASAATRAADELGYLPSRAAAHIALGSALTYADDDKQAEQVLLEATSAAIAGHDDHAAAQALTWLVVTGYDQSHYPQAHAWARLAEATLARIGGDDEIAARLATYEGNVFEDQGQYQEALDLQLRALAILTRDGQSDTPRAASVLTNLGNTYFDLKRSDDAISAFRRAVAIRERTQGARHPEVAYAINGIAIALEQKGQLDASLAENERALEIKREALGPKSSLVAGSLYNIGSVYKKKRQWAQSLDAYRQALAIWEGAYGPGHGKVAMTLTALGEVELLQGRAAAAVPLFERALVIRDKLSGSAADLAETRFGLARALWSSGGDRARARTLAELARPAYVAAKADDLPQLEAFLATTRP